MLQFDEYKVKLNNLAPTLEELGKALDLESAERELDMLRRRAPPTASGTTWRRLRRCSSASRIYRIRWTSRTSAAGSGTT